MTQPKSFPVTLSPVTGAAQKERENKRSSSSDQLFFHEVTPQDSKLKKILTDAGVEAVIGLCESDVQLVRQGKKFKLVLHPVQKGSYFKLTVLPEEEVFPDRPATGTLPHFVRKDLFAALE